jgi:hypothetical protein
MKVYMALVRSSDNVIVNKIVVDTDISFTPPPEFYLVQWNDSMTIGGVYNG